MKIVGIVALLIVIFTIHAAQTSEASDPAKIEAKVRPAVSATPTPRSAIVTVSVTSDPSGVDVYMNGILKGQTPLDLKAPRGYEATYRLEPDEDLYKSFSATLPTEEDSSVSVWLDRLSAEEIAERERAEKLERLERADLIIEGWTWTRPSRSSGNIKVEGLVTNRTNTTLKYVKADIRFFTEDDKFVTSDYTYLDYSTLLPGQSSPFTEYVDYNPSISYARLYFRDLSDSPLGAVSREDLPN